jgi:hypothetical protein
VKLTGARSLARSPHRIAVELEFDHLCSPCLLNY